jgi:hypothetical protein
VSFYLRRNDVRVYTQAQRSQLLADLETRPATLLFIKSGEAYAELVRALPGSLSFEPHGRQGNVIVARVAPRRIAPEYFYADRGPHAEREDYSRFVARKASAE